MVEYTPASGANGALISFDGDFRLLGNGYIGEMYLILNFRLNLKIVQLTLANVKA